MVPLNSYCKNLHQVVTCTKRLWLPFGIKVPERVIFIYESHSKGSIPRVHAVNTVGSLIEYFKLHMRVSRLMLSRIGLRNSFS